MDEACASFSGSRSNSGHGKTAAKPPAAKPEGPCAPVAHGSCSLLRNYILFYTPAPRLSSPIFLSFSAPGSSDRKADSYRTGASALPRTEAVMMPGEAGCSHHTPGGRVSPCVSVLFPSILRNVNAGDTGTVWSGASGFAILIYRKVSV